MTIRQLNLCETIISVHRNKLTYEQALTLNQLIFGSLCKRKLILYNAYHSYFFLTKEALELYTFLREWGPYRKNPKAALSIFTSKIIKSRAAGA